jgi:cytochrome c553
MLVKRKINAAAMTVLLVVSGVIVVACSQAPSKSLVATSQPATQPSAPSPTVFTTGPMAYFASNCARCHGPHGSAYGDTFASHLTDDYLKQVITDMANGPGNAPLQPPELDAQVKYHRAMLDKAPLIFLTQKSDTQLAGEVTPGSTLIATLTDGSAIDVEVKTDSTWSIGRGDVVQLEASRGGKRFELKLD